VRASLWLAVGGCEGREGVIAAVEADFGAEGPGSSRWEGFCGPARTWRDWLAIRFRARGGWAAAEVALAQALAVAFEREDFGVVDEPVDHRGGDDLVAEALAPGGEGLVAGDEQAGVFVAAADEREDQLGRLGVEADLADLVNHEQRRPEQPAQLLVEASLPFAPLRAGRPLRSRSRRRGAGRPGRQGSRARSPGCF
jgi:hypothetical protein